MSSPLLSCKHVSLCYGKNQALQDISFTIQKGERVALLGASGSGKSSLLSLLGLRITPSQGKLFFQSAPLDTAQSLAKQRSQTSSIPQNLALVTQANVMYNVLNGDLASLSFFQTLRRFFFPLQNEKKKAFKLLQRLGIAHKLYATTSTLSGGEQQRVALARALYANPSLLLADEPVSAIDPKRSRDLLSLMTTLCKEEGLTLITSLHQVELACDYFDRIIGLRHGKILFDNAPSNLQKKDFTTLYAIDD